MSKLSPYSVLTSVYLKDQASFVEESISSMLAQTHKPDEILVLQDGPVNSNTNKTLRDLEKKHSKIIRIVRYEKNRGLGPVLADGVKLARNDFIARMDADDIADINRCKSQVEFLEEHQDIAAVGTNVTEFIDEISNIRAKRVMPESADEIFAYSRTRNPIAHPSVMYNKQAVISAGNYRSMPLCEDYDLWVRMLRSGSKFHNLQQNLVYMRISDDFYARRGGIKYVTGIIKFKASLLKIGHMSLADFLKSASGTLIIGLAPNQIRTALYVRALRSQS